MSSSKIASKYTRKQLIDDNKESKLIQSLLRLTFEKETDGWEYKPDSNLQTKKHPSSDLPIYRVNRVNKSKSTMQQFFDFYEMQQWLAYDTRFDLKHCLDHDHGIFYLSHFGERDFNEMITRFQIPSCYNLFF